MKTHHEVLRNKIKNQPKVLLNKIKIQDPALPFQTISYVAKALGL
jgi:hypothetical protein